MGIILTADGVAEATVPMGVATLRDAFGTYTPGFLFLVALAALGALGVALLPGGKDARRGAGGAARCRRPARADIVGFFMQERAMSTGAFSRREFMAAAGTAAAAASLIPAAGWAAAPGARRRYALVGTGVRGTAMWGRDLVQKYADAVEFVGLCDINPLRVEVGKKMIGRVLPDVHRPRDDAVHGEAGRADRDHGGHHARRLHRAGARKRAST